MSESSSFPSSESPMPSTVPDAALSRAKMPHALRYPWLHCRCAGPLYRPGRADDRAKHSQHINRAVRDYAGNRSLYASDDLGMTPMRHTTSSLVVPSDRRRSPTSPSCWMAQIMRFLMATNRSLSIAQL